MKKNPTYTLIDSTVSGNENIGKKHNNNPQKQNKRLTKT